MGIAWKQLLDDHISDEALESWQFRQPFLALRLDCKMSPKPGSLIHAYSQRKHVLQFTC